MDDNGDNYKMDATRPVERQSTEEGKSVSKSENFTKYLQGSDVTE